MIGKTLSMKKLRKLMKNTCFGSISYCCGLKKPCPMRDKTIKKLGISKKDFVYLKKTFDKLLLFTINTGKKQKIRRG